MTLRRLMLAGCLVAALSLAACAANKEPFEYQSDNEAKQGRGVFTGEEGTWTIFRKPMPAEPQDPPAEDAETRSTEEAADSKQTSAGEPVPE